MQSELRRCPAPEILGAYNSDLQAVCVGLFKDIAEATKAPDVPTLADIARAYGNDIAGAWIREQLGAVSDFCNVREKLTEQQAFQLSIQILLTYGYLNLLEFILFCARLRSGAYCKFYGAINPPEVLQALRDFCRDRYGDVCRRETEDLRRKEEEELERRAETNAKYWAEYFREHPEDRDLTPEQVTQRRMDEMRSRLLTKFSPS